MLVKLKKMKHMLIVGAKVGLNNYNIHQMGTISAQYWRKIGTKWAQNNGHFS